VSVEAGRLAALERLTRAVAADIEAVGYMVGAGAAPLPWYAHLDVDGLNALGTDQRELLAVWHAAAVPELTDGWLDVVELRLVTPTAGYLLMRRVHADGATQLEWVARDDLPRWPL
jgi:hypothetical protein